MSFPDREKARRAIREVLDRYWTGSDDQAERIVDALAALSPAEPVQEGRLEKPPDLLALCSTCGIHWPTEDDGTVPICPQDRTEDRSHWVTLYESIERAKPVPATDPVRAALQEAIELAEEGWAYAGEYFVKKWDYEARRVKLRAALAAEEEPVERPMKDLADWLEPFCAGYIACREGLSEEPHEFMRAAEAGFDNSGSERARRFAAALSEGRTEDQKP